MSVRSSFCESELEFAENGNIRANTYKERAKGARKVECKSEEREKGKYFTPE
jgi:hypothetical protein